MTKADLIIRPAIPSDLPAILAIQNEIIATTNAIYCDDPETLEQRAEWFKARTEKSFPVFVAEEEGQVIGFGSYGQFRPRSGYRFTVEHSVHVTQSARGKGAGRGLLNALITHAKEADFHAMIGVIDSENHHSIRFHETFGFVKAGHMKEAANKNGAWLDVVFMQKLLEQVRVKMRQFDG